MVFKSISEALTVPKIKERSARAKVNKKVLSEKIRFKVVIIKPPISRNYFRVTLK